MKLVKRIGAVFLALTLSLTLAVPALAADRQEAEDAAWELYDLGLFLGTGTDSQGFPKFELDAAPTRAQSVTMLVRLLGAEEEAKAGKWKTPFTDVPEWAEPYIGYVYEKGLANGRGGTTFDPDTPVSASEYLTFILRALGYESGKDFQWNSAWTLSDRLKITNGEYNEKTTEFTRGDAAVVSLAALDVKPKGEDKTLREILGVTSATGACQWTEQCVACREGMMAFAFFKSNKSEEGYSKFEVRSATVNGVPCQVTQYTTNAEVRSLCRSLSGKNLPTGAFALVKLTYDEKKALNAATEAVTANGKTCPVLEFHLMCVGTLEKSGETVKEPVVLKYYIDEYGGIF